MIRPISIRVALAITILSFVNAVAAAGAPAAADRVAGEASVLAAGAPAVPVVGAPRLVLPPGGGTLVQSGRGGVIGLGGDVAAVAGVSATDQLAVSVEGAPTADGATVTSTATAGFVELFDGLVRATNVVAVATSVERGGRLGSSASVTFGSLLVDDLDYSNPRPNQRVELPGLGFVILNEQAVGGDGVTSASASVNALRVSVTEPNLQRVPLGTEIVVASAAAGVPEIAVTTAVGAGVAPSLAATPLPSIALSTRAPLDLSLDPTGGVGRFDFDNGNDDDEDNDNGEDAANENSTESSDNAASGSDNSPAGTQRPIVVTVVVVVTTPTSTPTPRPTAGTTQRR